MDRRAFLRASALALGGVALGACSREDASIDVFVGGDDFVAGARNYVAFALSRPLGGTVPVRFVKGDITLGPFDARAQRYGSEPLLRNAIFYATDVRFPTTGVWDVRVEGARPTVVRARARGSAGPPIAGARARAIATPTVSSKRGVDPICTRKPRCPFHTRSLDDALRSRDPIAFFVGSPKFCRSRTCGPNLEELITVAKDARTTIIHAEFHPNDDLDTVKRYARAPAVRAWRLQSEPWLFTVNSRGRIVQRFQGPIAADQMRAALARLR